MNLVLTERLCKSCQIRLTEFEIENNDGLCMECYKDSKTEEQE